MTDKTVRVVVYTEDFHGEHYSFSEGWSLAAFAENIAEWMAEVPEEYRHTAALDISCEHEYDSNWARLTVFYDRPETDEEQAEREHRTQVAAAHKRESELRTLAELKAKYGA